MKPVKKPRLPDALNPDKPKKILEKEVEEKVCAYARSLDFYVRKFTSPNHRAVPDRFFITPSGLPFYVEFKRPGEKLTGPQIREAARLLGHGQYVYGCDDIEKGKALIEAWAELRYRPQQGLTFPGGFWLAPRMM